MWPALNLYYTDPVQHLKMAGQDLDDLDRDLSDLDRDLADLGRDLSDLDRDLPDLDRDLSDLDRDLSDLDRDLSDLGRDLSDLGRDLSARRVIYSYCRSLRTCRSSCKLCLCVCVFVLLVDDYKQASCEVHRVTSYVSVLVVKLLLRSIQSGQLLTRMQAS